MEAIGMQEVRDLKELGTLYANDKQIADRVATAKAVKNLKKPVVVQGDGGAGISRKTLDPNVQRGLRELRNPQLLAGTRDALEHIEQELLYSNYDAAVDKIIETLRRLESAGN